MGWGKFLGDFAKGYISERGIDGALQDANSIKNGISQLFGSSDDDKDDSDDEELAQQYQQLWNEMVESINKKLDEQNFNGAFNELDSFYRNYENNEKDFYYYYWRGVIRFRIWQNSDIDSPDDQKLYSKATTEIGQAKQLMSTDDQRDMIKDLKQALKETADNRASQKAYSKKFDSFTNEFESLMYPDKTINSSKEEDYKQLFTKIDDFYAENENSYDAFYYFLRAKVYNSMFAYFTLSLDNGVTLDQNILKSKFAGAKEDTQRMVNLSNDSNYISLRNRINEQIEEIEQKLNTASKTSQTSVPANNQKNEAEYLDELKACLSDDNQISDRERRLLNRLRESLGISETRAKELEDSLINGGLTEDEKEYLDALKDSLVDGVISDRERRLLDKLRISLGISDDRAKELEQSLK